MSTCSCDGPPHPYEPSWCGIGRASDPPHGPLGVRQRAGGVVETREGIENVEQAYRRGYREGFTDGQGRR